MTQLLSCGVLLVALAGCAAKSPKTDIIWERSDGTQATRAELTAARDACEREVQSKASRFGNLDWGSEMLSCMRRKGFTRTEKPRQ